jgi:RNA recognition motif-containing protein
MESKLYVGNLSYDSTDGDIQAHFEQAGTVTSCQIMLDRMTNRSRGFAFVEMGSPEEAAKAIELLHQKDFMGRPLVVNEARPRAERPRGDFGGGGGGGYGGGGGGYGGGGGGGYGGGGGQGGQGGQGGKRKAGKGSRRGIRNAKRGGEGYW